MRQAVYKKDIVPDEWKENIDEIIETQLISANRQFVKDNSDITKLIEKESKLVPTKFYKDLKYRWNWHNKFYEELLQSALNICLEEDYTELSPSQVKDLIKIYETSALVDKATSITTFAIKKHLDTYTSRLIYNDNIGSYEYNDEVITLLTPPTESFYAQYQIDHLRYILAQKSQDKKLEEEQKSYLLKKYHINDEKVLAGRIKRFDKYKEKTIKELEEEIEQYAIDKNYKIKHRYFTMENPERKAFNDIIEYDNIDEKMMVCNLVGLSGLLFRKKILKYLNDSGILSNEGYIYEFSDEVIDKGLHQLLEQRKKYMEKKVTPYIQEGPTCAISCLLMTLDFYGLLDNPNREQEKSLFNEYRASKLEGSHFSAIANHLAKQGIKANLLHSEKEMFTNNENYMTDEQFKQSYKEYSDFLSEALNNGATVQNGVEIDYETIKANLEKDKMVIMAGYHEPYLHAVLAVGYKNDKIIIIDSLTGKRYEKDKQWINNFLSTPIGKWCIEVEQDKENKDDLMKSLPIFNEMANCYLEKKERNDLHKTCIEER